MSDELFTFENRPNRNIVRFSETEEEVTVKTVPVKENRISTAERIFKHTKVKSSYTTEIDNLGKSRDPGPPDPWTPAKLSGIIWGCEASRGVTSSSSLVSQWNDNWGGSGKPMLQATENAKPTLVSSLFGPVSGIRFDGTDDGMAITDATWASLAFARTDPFYMAVRCIPRNVSARQQLFGIEANQSNYGAGYSLEINASGYVSWRYRINSVGNGLEVRGSTVLVVGTKYTIEAAYDGSNTPGGISIYVDGVLETNTTVTNGLIGNISMAAGSSGNPLKLAYVPFDGEIRSQVDYAAAFIASGAHSTNADLRRWLLGEYP